MAFIPALNVVRVSMEFALPNEQVAVNVFNFQKDAAVLLADVIDITNVARDWWINNMAAYVSNQVSLSRVVGVDQTVADSYQYFNTASLPHFGTLSSNVLPASVTFAVSFKTGLAGRSNRGRVYHVGLAENEVTGDVIGGSTVTNIVDGYAEIPASLAGTGWTHVVCSYISNGTPRAAAQVTPIISYVNYDAIVDTQRRRLRGHGS